MMKRGEKKREEELNRLGNSQYVAMHLPALHFGLKGGMGQLQATGVHFGFSLVQAASKALMAI